MTTETKLNLCFLDKEQQNEIYNKRVYSRQEVNELLGLAFAIEKLVDVTGHYLAYKPDNENGEGLSSIFEIIGILASPIRSYLDGGICDPEKKE
ncbi:MAG: hypothetical protein FWE72_09345 [Spirochaetaceae bacterium]|nr:hypothetical protein [Spirochaetaceae bacterium]